MNMKEETNNGWWYSICYNTWMFDKTIKNELPLLLYITGFTANNWQCFASNQHFAEKFGDSIDTISRKVNNLIKKGYIKAQYIREGAKVIKRIITIDENDVTTSKMTTDGRHKWLSTDVKNDGDTITSITNTSITKEKALNLKTTAQKILDYYKSKFWTNKKAHKRAVAIDRILARLKLTSEPLIIKAIDTYFTEKDITEPQFVKPCENFFWNVPWTKHKFIDGFLDDIKDTEALAEIPLEALSESQLRIRIGGSLWSIRAFKTSVKDEYFELDFVEQVKFKELLKKVEDLVMREIGLYQ